MPIIEPQILSGFFLLVFLGTVFSRQFEFSVDVSLIERQRDHQSSKGTIPLWKLLKRLDWLYVPAIESLDWTRSRLHCRITSSALAVDGYALASSQAAGLLLATREGGQAVVPAVE